MQHTPAPWTREPGERFRHDQSAGVTGPNGSYVAAALDLNRYDKDEEVEANARLIAAAPDLLDALERLVHMAECNTVPGPNLMIQARAALAKARGETT